MTRYLDLEMAKDSIVIAYLKDRDIAIEFYAALCNMQWEMIQKLPEDEKIMEKLKGINSEMWSCSWRYAGGVIADIRNSNYNVTEDYMDFYCSGNEGTVTDRVRVCFDRMGWRPVPWENDE